MILFYSVLKYLFLQLYPHLCLYLSLTKQLKKELSIWKINMIARMNNIYQIK